MSQPRFPVWLAVLGAAAAVGFAGSVEGWRAYLSSAVSEQPSAGATRLAVWAVWATFAPMIVWLSVRRPIESPQLVPNLVIHGAASVACAVSQTYLAGFYAQAAGVGLESSWQAAPAFTGAAFGIVAYWDIWIITYAVRRYRRLQKVAARASTLEKQLAEAELRALKMQLQPHFLFNALNSISSLMRKDPRAAERMIARLGDFLRLTLDSSGVPMLPLERELEFLKAYLEIEQIRFRDRLGVKFEIDPQALEQQVPNLILQPIVENAIRHGAGQRADQGCVEIRAKVLNGSLQLQVADNGPGFNSAGGLESPSKAGFGLTNVRGRLRELYGPEGRLNVQNGDEGGTVVTVELPVRPVHQG